MTWIEALRAISDLEGKLVKVGVGIDAVGGLPTGAVRMFGRLERGRDRGLFLLVAGPDDARATIGAFEVPPALFESAERVEGLLLVTVGRVEIAIQEVE